MIILLISGINLSGVKETGVLVICGSLDPEIGIALAFFDKDPGGRN